MLLALLASSAHADDGRLRKRRILHASMTATLELGFLASDTFLKDDLASRACRWCTPPAFDSGTRKLLVWDNTARANTLSSISAYALEPLVGLGLLLASDHDAGLTRFVDDTLPVLEGLVVAQSVVQFLKLAVARQRPFAHFGEGVGYTPEENLSFPSGHSAFAFAITGGAGLICHWRHYWTEPYVWVAGVTLGLTTEYLRVAADRHYASDVLVGGGLGLAAGLLVPRLYRRDFAIVPTRNGIAFAGAF